MPWDYGNVVYRSIDAHSFTCCWIDETIAYGGYCDPGYVFDHVTVTKLSGGGTCTLLPGPPYQGDAYCGVSVRFQNVGLEGAICQIEVFQRHVCD